MTGHPHDVSYSSSPHKDRSDQRFHDDKFSDSGNSRRFDFQENVSVPGGFLTSTPQTKSQAVFSPPKSYQVNDLTVQLIFYGGVMVYSLACWTFNLKIGFQAWSLPSFSLDKKMLLRIVSLHPGV